MVQQVKDLALSLLWCGFDTWRRNLHTPWVEEEQTNKRYVTKNNHKHAQLGQIMDNKIQKDQKNPTVISKELGAKTGYQEQKQRPVHARCTPH